MVGRMIWVHNHRFIWTEVKQWTSHFQQERLMIDWRISWFRWTKNMEKLWNFKKSFSKSAFPFFRMEKKPQNNKTAKIHFWCSRLRPYCHIPMRESERVNGRNQSSRLSRLAKRFDKCSCSAFISDSCKAWNSRAANLNQEDLYVYFCTYWQYRNVHDICRMQIYMDWLLCNLM